MLKCLTLLIPLPLSAIVTWSDLHTVALSSWDIITVWLVLAVLPITVGVIKLVLLCSESLSNNFLEERTQTRGVGAENVMRQCPDFHPAHYHGVFLTVGFCPLPEDPEAKSICFARIWMRTNLNRAQFKRPICLNISGFFSEYEKRIVGVMWTCAAQVWS